MIVSRDFLGSTKPIKLLMSLIGYSFKFSSFVSEQQNQLKHLSS